MKQTGKEAAVIATTARVTAARLENREARPRRLTSILLWAVQILPAVLFVIVAVPKLTGRQQAVQEFGLIGAGQWLRYFVGTAELAGAIGLLTPWLAGLAAAGLAADMAGASIINATGGADQVEQAGLDGSVHPGRDPASGQSQLDFPWCGCSAAACSVTVARSRSISCRAAASSACSADMPGRPGTDADRASSAPASRPGRCGSR